MREVKDQAVHNRPHREVKTAVTGASRQPVDACGPCLRYIGTNRVGGARRVKQRHSAGTVIKAEMMRDGGPVVPLAGEDTRMAEPSGLGVGNLMCQCSR